MIFKINKLSKSSKILFFISILLVIFPSLMLLWFSYGNYFYNGEKEIQIIVEDITENKDNNLTKGIKIAQWEKDNIYNTYGNFKQLFYQKPFMDRPPYIKFLALFFFRNTNNPSWIIYSKYGACEEHAILFNEMAEFAGLETRLVKFPGEDHAIVEVKIDENLWLPIDATLPKVNISTPDPYYYEKHWWGNVSRVYYLDSTNKEHDITKNYTKTGNITIKIVGESNSPNDYTVNIISIYKGLSSVKGYPDENLTFKYELGDNNYRIIVENELPWGYGIFNTVDEKIVILNPNQSIFLEMKPEKIKINWIFLTIFIFVLSVSSVSIFLGCKQIHALVKNILSNT